MGNQIIQAGLQNTQRAKIHRIEAKPSVFPVPYHCISAKGEGAGDHMAAVVVGMLADQIDSARGKVGAELPFCAVKFLKFLDQFV